MVATSERFLGHGLLPITLYEPDFATLPCRAEPFCDGTNLPFKTIDSPM